LLTDHVHESEIKAMRRLEILSNAPVLLVNKVKFATESSNELITFVFERLPIEDLDRITNKSEFPQVFLFNSLQGASQEVHLIVHGGVVSDLFEVFKAYFLVICAEFRRFGH